MERERLDGGTGGWAGGQEMSRKNLFSHSVAITVIV